MLATLRPQYTSKTLRTYVPCPCPGNVAIIATITTMDIFMATLLAMLHVVGYTWFLITDQKLFNKNKTFITCDIKYTYNQC